VLQSLPICLILRLFLSVNLGMYKDRDPKISCDGGSMQAVGAGSEHIAAGLPKQSCKDQ
jgi:hypothetical protein